MQVQSLRPLFSLSPSRSFTLSLSLWVENTNTQPASGISAHEILQRGLSIYPPQYDGLLKFSLPCSIRTSKGIINTFCPQILLYSVFLLAPLFLLLFFPFFPSFSNKNHPLLRHLLEAFYLQFISVIREIYF